mmetsp:Transcript_96153/g.175964  ORF Transcript_96153/g.175964 Transcript_96153/m.175964 type:complete len:170 (+) Transcript_96153:179-688(+)
MDWRRSKVTCCRHRSASFRMVQPMPMQQPVAFFNPWAAMPGAIACAGLGGNAMTIQPVLQTTMQPSMQQPMQPQNAAQIWMPYLAGPVTGVAPPASPESLATTTPNTICTPNAAAAETTPATSEPTPAGAVLERESASNPGFGGTRAEDRKCPSAVFVDLSYLRDRKRA